jgi:hypothetical protein
VIVLAVGAVLALQPANCCVATERPPREPERIRTWLVGHLVADMEALGTFGGTEFAKVPRIVNALTDDQAALLARYYVLTRRKTEQDAYLYALQRQGYADEQINEAKAAVAELLTALNDRAVACYDEFVTMPEPVLYLAQVCYASVPGWCCRAGCFVPDWYYDGGCYLGPCFDSACAGAWAVSVCNAYRDHGSRFYSTYHGIPPAVRAARSTHMARRDANRFRHQGDWKGIVTHGRLLSPTSIGRHGAPPRMASGANGRADVPGSARKRAGPKRYHLGAVRHRDLQSPASHLPATRPHGAPSQATRAHSGRASTPHPNGARSSPKPRVPPSRPRHAAHVLPRPQHAVQAQPKSDPKRRK